MEKFKLKVINDNPSTFEFTMYDDELSNREDEQIIFKALCRPETVETETNGIKVSTATYIGVSEILINNTGKNGKNTVEKND